MSKVLIFAVVLASASAARTFCNKAGVEKCIANNVCGANSASLCKSDNACGFKCDSPWVLILDNAQMWGTTQADHTPLVTGQFTKFKAVWRSGCVSCHRGEHAPGPESHNAWQCCDKGYGSGANQTPIKSFELKKNNAYVVRQPNWTSLPNTCTSGSNPTDDIVCDTPLSIVTGDRLTPTWYEPSTPTSLGDNGGSLRLDLYGFRGNQEKKGCGNLVFEKCCFASANGVGGSKHVASYAECEAFCAEQSRNNAAVVGCELATSTSNRGSGGTCWAQTTCSIRHAGAYCASSYCGEKYE